MSGRRAVSRRSRPEGIDGAGRESRTEGHPAPPEVEQDPLDDGPPLPVGALVDHIAEWIYISLYMYSVEYQREAAAELKMLRAFDRVRALDAIARNLRERPASTHGSRKRLGLGGGDFIWQLRVGDYRVFYDVIEEHERVVVLHVRCKGPRTTGEIL